MDAKDIPPIKKHRKLLLGATYRKELIDENGESLYLASCNMPSSNNNPMFMILHHQLDVIYDMPIVCGCSKCLLFVIPQPLTLVQVCSSKKVK